MQWYAHIKYDFHFIFSSTVELEKLLEMERARKCRGEEKLGDKGSTEDSELQPIQGEYSPMSSKLAPVSPVSSPVSPVSSTGDQVQVTLPSSPPPESGYLHYHKR